MKPRISPGDLTALQYAGRLGHEYVVTIDDADAGRRVALQASDASRASLAARVEYVAHNPIVYRQTRPGVWRRVSR